MRACVILLSASVVALGCGTSSTAPDAGPDGGGVESGVDATLDAPSDAASDAPLDSPSEASCSGTDVFCSGACVDVQTNHDHCGQCTIACTSTQTCASGSCADITYGDITQSAGWLAYDLTPVDASITKGYAGGTFDGRYVYYAPESSVLLRYDTQSNAFATKGSWETFDASAVDTNAGSYLGAVFDGRYVYFIGGTTGPKLLRYDTKGAFNAQASYDTFDTTTVALVHSFAGGTFDGRYLYLAPWWVLPNYQHITLRYDTTAPFTQGSSWESYDLESVATNASGYYGCVFDGKYVSYVPLRYGNDLPEGIVVRFDTSSVFATPAAWSSFDTKSVDPSAAGYAGGAFDGKNVYFVPDLGHAARYDTTGAFTDADAGAWKTYATTNVDALVASLTYGGFDGRYVYMGASSKTKVVRVDTTAAFDQKPSWSEFDLASLTPSAGIVGGMIYDGRFMYFAPIAFGKVTARFDTKSATLMPALPQFHGSFF